MIEYLIVSILIKGVWISLMFLFSMKVFSDDIDNFALDGWLFLF